MNKFTSFVIIATVLTGCVSNPNTKYYNGAIMVFTVETVNEQSYRIVAKGAGGHSKQEVLDGFALRASELCEDVAVIQTLTIDAYDASGGSHYYSHPAFIVSGLVVCQERSL